MARIGQDRSLEVTNYVIAVSTVCHSKKMNIATSCSEPSTYHASSVTLTGPSPETCHKLGLEVILICNPKPLRGLKDG